MDKKEPIKVSLSTLLLVIALFVIIIMGLVIYYSNEQKKAAELKVTELKNHIESSSSPVVNEPVENEIKKEVPSATNAIKEEPKSPKDEAKNEGKTELEIKIEDAIARYQDITSDFGSGTMTILYNLGFTDDYPNPEDYPNGFFQDKPFPNSYFIETDIKYSDFEEALSKYMSFELFEEEFPNYIVNKNGKLCIYSDGGTTSSEVIDSCIITTLSPNTFSCVLKCTSTIHDDGRQIKGNCKATVVEENGIYKVTSYEVIDYKELN